MEIDYKSLGFKAGLEIHQQLAGKKLFCHCSTLNSDQKQDVTFERALRAVAGEQGDIDIAARHEMEKSKRYRYVGDSQDTCLIEYDETPPEPMNHDALETGIIVALLLNASIVDEIQVMRKTVVDGSNVSGFQRTALIARNGFVETSLGKVAIPTICLEEEACQKLDDTEGILTYKLDRLGIPLLEIATDASLNNPEHAKETASIIGMVLRSLPGIKRGLGTIRQDVNVSISQGARTEIKGFQDLRSIPKIIDFEIQRQLDEIKKGRKAHKEVRKAEPDFTTSFLRPLPGAARLYPETDVLPVTVNKKQIDDKRKNLPKLLTERISDIEKKYHLHAELARELVEHEHFDKLVTKFAHIEPAIIAHTLIEVPKEIKARFKLDPTILSYHDFEETLSYLEKKKISKETIIDILIKKIRKEKINLEEYKAVSEEDLEVAIKVLIAQKPDLSAGAYMGLLMEKYRGKVDGKKIMEMVRKYVK